MEGVVACWRWRNLTILGKIALFKLLVFSKIVFISYLNSIPLIEKIKQIQEKFLWDKKRPKIKYNTLKSDYKYGGLKSIDITAKFESLNLSWVKRLLYLNHHPWKIILLKLIQDELCTKLFYPNSKWTFDNDFPIFYQNIAKSWTNLSQEPLTAENILSQRIWLNCLYKLQTSLSNPHSLLNFS